MIRRVSRIFALAVVLLLPALPATAKGFVSDRITLHTHGQAGPDIVLIPGLGSSPEIWADTVKALPGYRIHLVQVHGFAGVPAGGNAQAAGAAPNPVLPKVAAEIARYLTEQNLKGVSVIGHSMGGNVGLLVADTAPDRVARVMVVDMLPFLGMLFGPPGTTPESVEPVAAATRTRMATATGEPREQALAAGIAGMVKTEGLRATPTRHAVDSDAAVSGQAMYDLITTDLRPRLPQWKKPLTVLWVKPPTLPLTDAQMEGIYRLSFAGAPQAKVAHVPDAGHFIMLDAPDRFHAMVRDFLADR